MQLSLQISCETPAEMIKVLAAFNAAQEPANAPPVHVVAEQKPTIVEVPGTEVEPEPKRAGGRPRKTVLAPRTDIPHDQPVYKAAPKPELKVVEKPEKPEEKEPEVTMAMVRNALTKFLAANTEVAATALLKKFGHTDRLSQLKVEYFPAVYAAAVTPVVSDAPSIFNDDISDVGA